MSESTFSLVFHDLVERISIILALVLDETETHNLMFPYLFLLKLKNSLDYRWLGEF